ncbi:MAG: hypothetical protein M1438_06125 [Deltaproteobacteria bacterium]|nr:hypothetical protein [Deltaproteobacteria bacterium]
MRKIIALAIMLACCLQSPVQADDGTQPVVFLGSFSDMRATEEHQYGAEVRLWRQGSDLFGFFSYADGLSGDTPTGLLNDLKYEPKTGRLSFQAKLTMGWHYCNLHRASPAHDLFTFQGILAPAALSGNLQLFDGLHPEKQPEGKKVVLRKIAWNGGRHTDYQSRSQWDKEVREILNRLGPKW